MAKFSGAIAVGLGQLSSASLASDAETIAGTLTTKAVTPDSREAALPVIDPRKYGLSTAASGAVNRAAIQSAIDEACGATDPVTTVRTATRCVEIPRGTYLIDAPITVRSVIGLQVRGVGYAALQADADMASVFDINGACLCKFSNFAILTTSGKTVDNGIYLYWDIAGSLRSTTLNHFSDIWIACQYKVGFRVGKIPDTGGPGGITAQVDNDIYENITISGAWTAGEATLWQEGLHLGTGTYGNNLVHHCYKLQLNNSRYNLVVDSTQVGVYGGGFTGAEADIKLATTNSVFSDIRSEGSTRFILGVIAGYASTVTVSDLEWHAELMDADGQWIKYYHGGVFRLEQIQCCDPAITPVILATGGAATDPLHVQVDGFIAGGAFTPTNAAACFSFGTATRVEVRGFVRRGTAGATVSVENWESPAGVTKVIEAAKRIWIPASAFLLLGGAPAYVVLAGRYQSWAFDQTTVEYVTVPVKLPPFWANMAIDVHWSQVASGTGNVLWFFAPDHAPAGSTLAVSSTAPTFTAAAVGATSVLVVTSSTSIAVTPVDTYALWGGRNAADGSDTLANDALMIGVMLREVT